MEYLYQVLSTKPAEVMQEVIQMLEEHGYFVNEELKSELYYIVARFAKLCSKYCTMTT